MPVEVASIITVVLTLRDYGLPASLPASLSDHMQSQGWRPNEATHGHHITSQ